MECEDENIVLLLSMGFPDISEIKRALEIAKNDVNEAVSVLTSEQNVIPFSVKSDASADVEMKDVSKPTFAVQKEPALEFPSSCLYELRSRVFVDQWSIPYKQEEAFGKCLQSAIRLANEGLCEIDENCKTFIETCMPEAFRKLLTSCAVKRWNTEVQEGIFNMLKLFIEFLVKRLKHEPVPCDILRNVLATALDPQTEWNKKNRTRVCDASKWNIKFGSNKSYAVDLSQKSKNMPQDPQGWLVDLINYFGELGGFHLIQDLLHQNFHNLPVIAALIYPFARCADLLNPSVISPLFVDCSKAIKEKHLETSSVDIKSKNTTSIFELVWSLRCLCSVLYPQELSKIDNIRFEIILNMLKSSNFNAGMNALKEMSNLLEESENKYNVKFVLDVEKILSWMEENKVLSTALNGNIDHIQYTERMKSLIEFIGDRLSLSEIKSIWNLQKNHNSHISDNVYTILAGGAAKFTKKQLVYLCSLIEEEWNKANDRVREKLIIFLGRISREGKNGPAPVLMLEVLWKLLFHPKIHPSLILLALEEQLAILNDMPEKEKIRKCYVEKVVKNIQNRESVTLSLKLLHSISSSIMGSSIYQKQDRAALCELNNQFDIFSLVVDSLSKFQEKKNITQPQVHERKVLYPGPVQDGLSIECDGVITHLEVLKLFLKQSDLYLSYDMCATIWNSLVTSGYDPEICFEWFQECLHDLEHQTQLELFQQNILQLQPSSVSSKAFSCFQTFFENVNAVEHKIKLQNNVLSVERLDLTGLDYLERVALETSFDSVAEMAIQYFLQLSYSFLNPKLKQDPVDLHNKFIEKCCNKMEVEMQELAPQFSKGLGDKITDLRKIRMLGRLLLLMESYVTGIEEGFSGKRSIIPHGVSYHGYPLQIILQSDAFKTSQQLQSHNNQTIEKIRAQISSKLESPHQSVELSYNDAIIPNSMDQHPIKIVLQGDFTCVRLKVSPVVTQSVQFSEMLEENWDEDEAGQKDSSFNYSSSSEENVLPSNLMSNNPKIYSMMYKLSLLDDPKLGSLIKRLLNLIPTDSAVLGDFDTLLDSSNESGSADANPKPMTAIRAPAAAFSKDSEILRSAFVSVGNSMSNLRLLYNLEVLSGKIVPVSSIPSELQTAAQFRKAFISCGGLKLISLMLQKDVLSVDADYNIRQDCCYLTLYISRALMFDDIYPNLMYHDDDVKPTPPKKKAFDSSIITNKEIQEMMLSLVRVAWAAAAGKLHLHSIGTPSKENIGFGSALFQTVANRSRQNSCSSNNSSSSDTEPTLHAGICFQQETINHKDCVITQKSLEFLLLLLTETDSDMIIFFLNLPYIKDFVIDLILMCPHQQIQQSACNTFYQLATVKTTLSDSKLSPRQYFIKMLMETHVPLWVSSSSARGTSQKLLKNCAQYFRLLCRLLEDMPVDEEKNLFVNIRSWLEDELAWLQNFSSSSSLSLQQSDNLLLAGHLTLIRTLIRRIKDNSWEKALLPELLHSFLFPALQFSDSGMPVDSASSSVIIPKCRGDESREAAFQLLLELSLRNSLNYDYVLNELVVMNHSFDPQFVKEFEYEPPVEGRASCGYVGLKNAGATCYMNSVIQQLFLVPGLKESILSVDSDRLDEDNILYQLQCVFAHLLESEQQFYSPTQFWQSFKLWGQPVNVREQQDAFEFFTDLCDQIDEQLKCLGHKKLLQNRFEGRFSDQKICQGCPHRYEREEVFLALNLPIKSLNLVDSLDQFVRGELLEGSNAYYCEKCSQKRSAIKRTCIKSLPTTLVIQLKRFGYDWEANRALKFDDYFEFPWELDMGPYTVEGVRSQERFGSSQECSPSSPSVRLTPFRYFQSVRYQLVGVIVHSGQANAGHYYSYIKDRRHEVINNPKNDKWLKFNDTTVEEVVMTNDLLATECFGGAYRAKVSYDSCNTFPEMRSRYWSAYLLFYEKMEDKPSLRNTKKLSLGRSKSLRISANTPQKCLFRRESDSLSELTQLVHHGEKQRLFCENIPVRIQQIIQEENRRFMQNRFVYCDRYNDFLLTLCSSSQNINAMSHLNQEMAAVSAVKLAAHFVFNTHFRTKRQNSKLMEDWLNIFNCLLISSQNACRWLHTYLGCGEGRKYLRSYLLECPVREVRATFSHLLENSMNAHLNHHGKPMDEPFNGFMNSLLSLIEKDVTDNVKTCSQFFTLIYSYTQMEASTCQHLFDLGAFSKILAFLLGPQATHNMGNARYWSASQSREFSGLYFTLSALVQSFNLEALKNGKDTTSSHKNLSGEDLSVSCYIYGDHCPQLIHELICAIRELSGSVQSLIDMMVLLTTDHVNFTETLLKHLLQQFGTVPSSELKKLSDMLLDLLVIEDQLQIKRLQLVIEGVPSENLDGILGLIKTHHTVDSRRSYQSIKLLVSLCNRNPMAKDYLLEEPSTWQWAVNWLKNKMADLCWSVSSNLSNDDTEGKIFQRTVSAQDTLAEASAFLIGMEGSLADENEMKESSEVPELN